MSIVLGIDIGGSATKVIGMNGDVIIDMIRIKAENQVASLGDSIDRFIQKQNITHDDISDIYLTGIGSGFVEGKICGINTHKVSEFDAIGRGGLRLPGYEEALVISMGTGTAFVMAKTDEYRHIGGTGIGGGTIIGLASQLLDTRDVDKILELAKNGDKRNVDLLIGDAAGDSIDNLPVDVTAANFGKKTANASKNDIAAGLINMVFETIGMMAVFALRNEITKDVVLTGALAAFPQAKDVFGRFSVLSDIRFHIPPDAEFATAFGALPR